MRLSSLISKSLIAAFVLTSGSALFGQGYIQQGRLLEANSRVGSGGYNQYSNQYSQYDTANRIMSGNVTGGRSFRGFSPIGDPNQIFSIGSRGIRDGSTSSLLSTRTFNVSGLPSDSLSGFRRDSFNYANYSSAGVSSYTPLPYYSASSSVTNVNSIVSGLNRPGTSQLQSSYIAPSSAYLSTPVSPLDDAGSSVGQSGKVPSYTYRPESTLGRSVLMSSARYVEVSTRDLKEISESDRTGAVLSPDALPGEAVDMHVDSRVEPYDATGVEPVVPAEEPLRMIQPAGDMTGTPAGPMTGEAQGGLAADRGGLDAIDLAAAGSQGSSLGTGKPLQSLSTARRDRFGSVMREAEKLLREGEYYRAAGRYELAGLLDSGSPLSYLGRAMSLLAAGDYMTSSRNLLKSVSLFGADGMAEVDLKAFIPDLEMLDRRRADLEDRLERNEVWQMRFLLGYAEYCSGLGEVGLSNLDRAAKVASDESPDEAVLLQKLIAQLRGTDTSDSVEAEAGKPVGAP